MQALQNLYDFSGEEAQQVYDWTDNNPLNRVVVRLRKVISPEKSDLEKTLRDFKSGIEQYLRYYEDGEKSPLVKKVHDDPKDEETCAQVLIELGAKRKETGMGFTEIEAQYQLSYIIRDHDEDGVLYHPEKKKLTHLRTFYSQLNILLNKGGKTAVRRYLEDFTAEFTRLTNHWAPKILSRERLLANSFAQGKSDSIRTLERMGRNVQAYLRLYQNNGLDFLSMLPPSGATRLDHLQLVTDAVDGLISSGVNIHNASQLITTAPLEARIETTEYLLAKPESMQFYSSLKRSRISKKRYVHFLLNHADFQLDPENPATAFEIIQRIAETDSQREAAKVLLDNCGQLFFDINTPEIIQISSQYKLAHLVISDYFEAISHGETYRAKLSLKLGHLMSDSHSLKAIRKRAKAVDDDKLAEIVQFESVKDIETGLKGLSITANKIRTEKAQPQLSWYEILLGTLRHKGDLATAENVERVYSMMDPVDQYRIRNIWKTQPETIDRFCADIIELYDSHIYQSILSSHILFRHYKERLREDNPTFSADLRNVMESSIQNVYKDLCSLLTNSDSIPDAITTPDDEVTDAEDLRKKGEYGRILIWGGQYSAISKERICCAVPGTEIVVFDQSDKNHSPSMLNGKDLVVWVTTSNDHSSYYSVKSVCRKRRVGFVHFNRAGYKPLVEMLQNFAA